jgi:hypothetical protein
VGRFLDWLASVTCSWEIRLHGPGNQSRVLARGWWPFHSRERVREKARKALAAPSRREEET